MIVKIFSVSCPPHVLANTGGGHEIDLFLLISGTVSFQALIKLITMGECHESGEGASINADRYSEKLGLNVDRRPQAGGPH